jgi:hypothetical protein
MKNWYDNLSNEWKASIRTFGQSLVGGLLVALLGLLNSALNWLNNQPVDLYKDLSNISKAFGIVVVSAVISFVTFIWNKVGKTAEYDS